MADCVQREGRGGAEVSSDTMNDEETDAATETMEGTVAEEDESTNLNDEVYDSEFDYTNEYNQN